MTEVMDMVVLTPEQFEITEHITHEDGMILVSAGPGTGKTFVAQQIIKALSPTTVLYTAFNKAIVEEGKEKFGGLGVYCKTLHAVAYQYTQPSKEIRATNYKDLPDKLSYDAKYKILQGLERFFVSSSSNMWEFFEEHFQHEEHADMLSASAVDLINKMLEGKMAWSFSFMLKYFHLMLVENPALCSYGLVILDEINDTTAVALEIFKLIKAPKKLGLGDPHQAIYSFMHLVNGFEELKDVPVYPLTNSFRCSKEIASKIENLMKSEVDETVSFKGTDKPVANGKTLYCTMTNAAIINELVECSLKRRDYILLRSPVDIFACALAVLSASNGKDVYQTQYKYLKDVYKDWENSDKFHKTFFAYLLAELNDQEVHSAVRLLMSLKQKEINLFSLYSEVKAAKQKGDYTIATVYTSKGLEFETVNLSNEFDSMIEAIRADGGVNTEERLSKYRCYYVAASRAGKTLNNALALNM